MFKTVPKTVRSCPHPSGLGPPAPTKLVIFRHRTNFPRHHVYLKWPIGISRTLIRFKYFYKSIDFKRVKVEKFEVGKVRSWKRSKLEKIDVTKVQRNSLFSWKMWRKFSFSQKILNFLEKSLLSFWENVEKILSFSPKLRFFLKINFFIKIC